MKLEDKALIGAKALTLKNFASFFKDMDNVFSLEELGDLAHRSG